MRLINRKLLLKHLKKNQGNKSLELAIGKLIKDLENHKFKTPNDLLALRKDADKVHPDGFYFFNLVNHRTMILIEFIENESTVIWCGDHDSYEFIFKNNKNTIKKWLRQKQWIK